MKNLKEEIKRIKDLFTEGRLYGNMVNEATNPDTNNDGKIDSSEFSASGNEIDTEEGKLFLKGLGYKKIERDYGEAKSASDLCMKSPIIKTVISKSEQKLGTANFQNFKPMVNANSGICYLSLKSPFPTGYIVKKIALWNDKKLTFYIQLDVPIDFSNGTELKKSMPNLSSSNPLLIGVNRLGQFLTTKKINYLRYFANYDPSSWTYDKVEFAGFYDETLKRTAKPIENTIIDNFYYNPGGTSVDVDVTQILTNSSYCDINLNGSVNDLLGKMS